MRLKQIRQKLCDHTETMFIRGFWDHTEPKGYVETVDFT